MIYLLEPETWSYPKLFVPKNYSNCDHFARLSMAQKDFLAERSHGFLVHQYAMPRGVTKQRWWLMNWEEKGLDAHIIL